MALVANEHQSDNAATDTLEIFLQSGELYFGSAPTIISTMLHSRTVITFWHPRTRIGGMCHVVKVATPKDERDMQYGDFAIAEFAGLADKYKTLRSEYEVRIFDGKVNEESNARQHEIMLDSIGLLLKQQGFIVKELDAFANSSRKITLDMASGGVAKREIGTPKLESKQDVVRRKKDDEFAMEIFLHPGELYFGRAPTIVSTLLGSCVAVTLWHPKEKIGGMCHIVLPESPEGKYEMRYGDYAIAEFAKQIIKYATRTNEYEVHIYGGSDMFPDMKKSEGMKIGNRNIEKTKELLKLYKFHVKEIDTGGNNSRKIKLDLSDGSVEVRKTSRPVEA